MTDTKLPNLIGIRMVPRDRAVWPVRRSQPGAHRHLGRSRPSLSAKDNTKASSRMTDLIVYVHCPAEGCRERLACQWRHLDNLRATWRCVDHKKEGDAA